VDAWYAHHLTVKPRLISGRNTLIFSASKFWHELLWETPKLLTVNPNPLAAIIYKEDLSNGSNWRN
jgi:hypothetical protein